MQECDCVYDRIEPIKVIDLDFNYKAQIDDYETLIVKRKWQTKCATLEKRKFIANE